MASDTYYKYQDLEKDSDKLYIIPNDIIIYLVQSQVDQIRAALTEAARAKGKLRDKNINTQNFILTDAVQSGVLLDSDVYVLVKGENPKYLGPGDSERYLDMFPKVNDANRLAQTDISYNKDDPDSLPDDRNFVKKLHKWIDLELIKKDDYNNIIMSIVRSSGSVHNDWVYSLSGEDSGRGEGEVLDIHDRRIDDPNIPLTVKGGVNVGDPDNASDRKKLSVFGETELQDGSTMGRLLDTYGEQHPMEFGHLIPNQGQYPKVYINRGEDRFNAEDWDDTDNAVEYWRYDTSGEENEWRQIAKSEIPSGASIIAVNILPDEPIENTYYAIDVQIPYYGIGFGTIEAYREIVSHTTVNADRGMVIEDGLGDYTDKVIEKHTDKGNTFDPTGTQTHQTNGFALSIHHDGAKIKGHTYIQDEGSANLFFKEDNTIYKANVSNSDGFDIVTDIKRDCWFCEITNDEENDWQYTHYCTNKDNDIEPVVDKWPGHLYYDGILKIKGHEGWKYRIYFINEQQQKDYIEYYYQNGVFFVIESQKDTASGQIYKINNDYFTSDKTLSEILTENGYLYKFKGEYTNDEDRYAERTADYPIYLVDKLTIVEGQSELSYKGHIRVRPKTNKVYQINKAYTETNQLYGLVEVRLNELDEPIPYDANTYFYWDGIKFKPITAARDTYNQKQDYGSLTIGTRAQNNEQDNDTIGKHSAEIGTENEATGENALAQGSNNIASGIYSHAEGQLTKADARGSHAEGLGTKIGERGLFSHIEGLGDYSELVEYEDENDFFGENGGKRSEVTGIASHAEGYAQKVEGRYNHAEGSENQILGSLVTSAHVEGSENIINDNSNFSHTEGKNNIILANKEGAHAAGAGNIVDRRYQHLEGVLAKTTHTVYSEYSEQTSGTSTSKPVMFAIGDGDSPTRADQSGLTPAADIVGNRDSTSAIKEPGKLVGNDDFRFFTLKDDEDSSIFQKEVWQQTGQDWEDVTIPVSTNYPNVNNQNMVIWNWMNSNQYYRVHSINISTLVSRAVEKYNLGTDLTTNQIITSSLNGTANDQTYNFAYGSIQYFLGENNHYQIQIKNKNNIVIDSVEVYAPELSATIQAPYTNPKQIPAPGDLYIQIAEYNREYYLISLRGFARLNDVAWVPSGASAQNNIEAFFTILYKFNAETATLFNKTGYQKSNLFAVTEDGDTYVAGHLEVDGTSDLSDRVTVGDSTNVIDHNDATPALDVLKHSRFREKVTIDRDGQATADLDMTWPTDDISLAVKGESLFGDTLTIGEAGDRDEETGTFWTNFDESDPFNAKSSFNGLYVHGEIHNERIPQELYTSMPVGQDIVLNEFADKFFVNSSIATSTATYRGSYSAIDYAPHVCESITPVDLDDYTVIEYRYNLPTKYTNQIIFDDSDPNVKPTIFYLNNNEGWTPTVDIHPYEIGHPYAKGYYKFTYETGALINPTKEQIATWLYNHVWKINLTTQVINVNSYTDLPISPEANKYYYVIDEDKYYNYDSQNSEWVEQSPSANNNDYCYFQIWDKKDAEPYVLFAETYDDEGNLITPFVDDEKDPEQEMEIICYRYKFSETRHPSSGAILSSKWVFEYQLNNSGFTQAQWAAINSGISGAWMSNIQTQINNLSNTLTEQVNLLSGRIDDEIEDRAAADRALLEKFAEYYTKTESDNRYYTKTESDNRYYTKNYIDTTLEDYATISWVNNQSFATISSLDDYYTKTASDNRYYTKTDSDDRYYTKTASDNKYVTFAGGTAQNQEEISGYKKFTAPIGLGNSTLSRGASGSGYDFILPQTIPENDSGELALKSDIENIMPFSAPLTCTLDRTGASMTMLCSGTKFDDQSVEGVIMGIIPKGWNFFNWSNKNYTIDLSRISGRLSGHLDSVEFSTNVESGMFQPSFSLDTEHSNRSTLKFSANPPAGKMLFLYFKFVV